MNTKQRFYSLGQSIQTLRDPSSNYLTTRDIMEITADQIQTPNS